MIECLANKYFLSTNKQGIKLIANPKISWKEIFGFAKQNHLRAKKFSSEVILFITTDEPASSWLYRWPSYPKKQDRYG